MSLDEARDALFRAAELIEKLQNVAAACDAVHVIDVARREFKRAADAYERAVAQRGIEE